MSSADPNPGWTRAPWAGLPNAASTTRKPALPPLPADAGRLPLLPEASDAAVRDAAAMPPPGAARSAGGNSGEDTPWAPFFHTALDVPVGADVFRVYLAGRQGPLVLCLHGAGYTGLTWAAATPTLVDKASCRVAAMVRRDCRATRVAPAGDSWPARRT
jgi:hypothetical protein